MAEAAVIQKIKKDILSCYICSSELKDPIGLPCLHGFCSECLETWHQDSKDKTQVICPACKKSTLVPKEGIGGFPRHFLVHNLQDTMDKKRTKPKADIQCDVCGKKAAMHCTDCKRSLCQQCLMNHNEFIKDHHLANIAEFQSGQVSTEGRICPLHGEKVRYYCETEEKQVCMDCISLKTCHIEHARVTLKEAAKKQMNELEQLTKKCADNKKRFQNAIKDSDILLGTLQEMVKQAKHKVERIEKNTVGDIIEKTKVLKSEVGKIEDAENQTANLTASNSDYLITYKYSSLSEELNQLSLLEPVRPAISLEELSSMAVPSGAHELPKGKWRFARSFPTRGMTKPSGIAVDNDGDVIVTSHERGVKVYSRNGKVMRSFMEDSTSVLEVAVSHDSRYIIAGETYSGLCFFTNRGKRITRKPVLDVNYENLDVISVAVDANDRIITASLNNTVSIHYADGTLISQFARDQVFRVVPTCEGELVCSSPGGLSLELMDYSGSNVRLLQPPPEVKVWTPGHLCSTQGEIFVVNRETGNPAGIFSYTSKGEYLGCVTTDDNVPKGVAVSPDGMQLFLAEYDDCVVKIFERE